MDISNVRIRDPYVLVENGTYYLYKNVAYHDGTVIFVHKSRDLNEWDEGREVYSLDRSGWKDQDCWAPEVHKYKGKYYMFLSILGKNGLRGTEISVCDTPDGTFVPLTDGAATPSYQSCIDGTLYIEDEVPYIVYSRDWPHCFDESAGAYVGEIWACAMTDDLTKLSGEPFCLFRSNEVPLSAIAPARNLLNGVSIMRYGSDAPFIVKLPSGRIFLTWSPIPGNNYVVLGAISDSIHGEWTHIDKPLFDSNGGHAMFFTDLEGVDRMAIHCPERDEYERALFLPVNITDDGISLK